MASRAGDQGDGARRPRHPRDGLRRGALAGGAPRARCGPRAGETAQDPGDPGRGRAGGAPPRLADLNGGAHDELRVPDPRPPRRRRDDHAQPTRRVQRAHPGARAGALPRRARGRRGPSVRCVVVTGAGKAFCAGGDVKDFADNLPRIGVLVKELTTYLHGAVSRFARSDKPVIMAVNGVAAGGGFSFALSGDLVLAAESARFTMAYSKIAATPDG